MPFLLCSDITLKIDNCCNKLKQYLEFKLTSIIAPIPAGTKTNRLVFSFIRYRKIIAVDTHRHITKIK